MIPPEAQCVFAGEIFSVYQWPQRLYDGSVATFEMVRRPDTVFVIAVDDAGNVLVNDEEQPGGIVRRGHFADCRVSGLPLPQYAGRHPACQHPHRGEQRTHRFGLGFCFNRHHVYRITGL